MHMIVWWLVVASLCCEMLSVVGLDKSMSQQQVLHFQELTADGIFMYICLVAKEDTPSESKRHVAWACVHGEVVHFVVFVLCCGDRAG